MKHMMVQLLHVIIIIINKILELQVVQILIHHGILIQLKLMVKCLMKHCDILNYEDENTVRNYFTEFLDKEQSYVFTLIHHNNIHIID